MQQELATKIIAQGTIGLIFLALLLILLFALRKDIRRKKRISGIVFFALAMMGFWCFLAFAEVYRGLRRAGYFSAHPDPNGTTGSKRPAVANLAAFAGSPRRSQ